MAVRGRPTSEVRRIASAGPSDEPPALDFKLLSPTGVSRLNTTAPMLPRQESLRYQRQASAPVGDDGRGRTASAAGDGGRTDYRRMHSAHLETTGTAAPAAAPGSRIREVKLAPVLSPSSSSTTVTVISAQERALMRMKSLEKIGTAADTSPAGGTAGSPRTNKAMQSWGSTVGDAPSRGTVGSPRGAQAAQKAPGVAAVVPIAAAVGSGSAAQPQPHSGKRR